MANLFRKTPLKLYLVAFVILCETSNGLQQRSSRRDIVIAGGTVLSAYFYAKTLEFLYDPPIVYPSSHEDRVRKVIRTTLDSAASTKLGLEPIRLLEVGIGTGARLIRRDLYDFGIVTNTPSKREIHMVGLDPNIPTSPGILRDVAAHLPPTVTLELHKGSISERTSFPDGYFDAIVCCLTLCSVDDPMAALVEMKRLLRPHGGSWGFCEHVAAAEGSLFGRQQLLLDPLQQMLAANCHLHRKTQETIRAVFRNDVEYLFEENFFINEMWPASVQCCGVLQVK